MMGHSIAGKQNSRAIIQFKWNWFINY